MVETTAQPLSNWWPNIADPLRRFGAQVADYFSPASDAAVTDDAYIVEVELPGVKDEDITIEQHGNGPRHRGPLRSLSACGQPGVKPGHRADGHGYH